MSAALRTHTRSLLRARGLVVGHARVRRRRTVIEDLDLSLRAGELVCLLGRNGSSKSTLLRTLTGLLPPLAGQVELQGRDLARCSPRQRARRLAAVGPAPAPIGPITVAETVALGRYPYTRWHGRLTPVDRRAVAAAMASVGIEALVQRRVETLSDGERQKTMVARALAQEAEILVLDEPTAFLDITARAELMLTLAALAARGRAVVASSHDLDLALRHAGILWLIDRGRLQVGAPRALLQDGSLERAFGAGVAPRADALA